MRDASGGAPSELLVATSSSSARHDPKPKSMGKPGAVTPGTASRQVVSEEEIAYRFRAELARQAGSRLQMAYTKFTSAVNNVKDELRAAAKKVGPTFVEQLLEVMIGVLAPVVGKVIFGALNAQLKEMGTSVLKGLLPSEDVPLFAPKMDKLVDDYIGLSSEHANAGVKLLMEGAKREPKLRTGGVTPTAQAPMVQGGQPPVGGPKARQVSTPKFRPRLCSTSSYRRSRSIWTRSMQRS